MFSVPALVTEAELLNAQLVFFDGLRQKHIVGDKNHAPFAKLRKAEGAVSNEESFPIAGWDIKQLAVITFAHGAGKKCFGRV